MRVRHIEFLGIDFPGFYAPDGCFFEATPESFKKFRKFVGRCLALDQMFPVLLKTNITAVVPVNADRLGNDDVEDVCEHMKQAIDLAKQECLARIRIAHEIGTDRMAMEDIPPIKQTPAEKNSFIEALQYDYIMPHVCRDLLIGYLKAIVNMPKECEGIQFFCSDDTTVRFAIGEHRVSGTISIGKKYLTYTRDNPEFQPGGISHTTWEKLYEIPSEIIISKMDETP